MFADKESIPMAEVVPIFCLRTTDKTTQRRVFINFKSSDEVPPPEVDITEDQIVQEIYNPSRNIENLKVPLILGQIYWSNDNNSQEDDDNDKKCDRNYVIEVQMNSKFAIRKVLSSEIIRHYVLTVAMASIMEKFNSGDAVKITKQFIGHKLDLDQASYEVLKDKLEMRQSDETVTNKITLVEECSTKSPDVDDSNSYDLHYRPGSMLLTCSLRTDKLPDSIRFNDDRFCVELDGKNCVDVHLPIQIDLRHPVKYKFDDRLCLLRIVFKMMEPNY